MFPYDLSVVAAVLSLLACPAPCGGCVFQVGVPVLSHLSAIPLEPLILPLPVTPLQAPGFTRSPLRFFARHISQALAVHISRHLAFDPLATSRAVPFTLPMAL